MERPSKRRRLFAPLDSELSQSFDNRHAYYDKPDELYEEEGEPAYNPELDLQQKRARLDLKLKSTFESIFEKYGKSFDGVGDEIDLYTGEIIVDNGHLLQMQDERDAGDPSHARRIPRTLAEDSHALMSSSVDHGYLEDEDDEDEDDEDEDYDNEGALSDEDMVEDDLILRGFTQARQFMERRPPLQQNTFGIGLSAHNKEPRRSEIFNPAMERNILPSRSDILSQFGPQLGPEIAKYVSQQGTLEDENIEPIWRAPPIFPATSVKRPVVKAGPLQPEVERAMSPDNSPSIWAPKRPRFLAEDDELLQAFVAKARRIGLDLSTNAAWKRLEDVHPHHDWKGWKTRYEKKFSYLYTRHADESEISTSEISADTPLVSNRRDFVEDSRLDFVSSTSRLPPHPTTNERPTRVRKPAQRDSTIISWTDAVAAIESLDPDLHARLLMDVKNMESEASFHFKPLEPSSQVTNQHSVQVQSISRKQLNSNRGIGGRSRIVTHSDSNNALADTEDELSLPNSEFYSESQKVPCPHSDCRDSKSTLYRLGCYDGEELSPLCLHLLRTHHITPFPCAEFNCDRKGDRGYFTQQDLVHHVKEAHPYATALSRLRGRVDAELLDRGLKSTYPKKSAHGTPHTPISQPRNLDFISQKGRVSRLAQPRPHLPSSGSLQDLASTPRQGDCHPQVSTTASSHQANPSSSTSKDLQAREYSVEKLYDSDVQILNSNPFLADSQSSNQTVFSCAFKDSAGCEETFTTQDLASTHSLVHNREKANAPCSYAGSKRMISTALPSNMIAHPKNHEEDRSNISMPSAKQVTTSELQSSIPTTIPNSFRPPASHTHNPTSTTTQKNKDGSTKRRMSNPLPRNTVDPAYEFSDEELELPPLPKEAPLSKKAGLAQPRPGRKSMPSSKTSAKTSSVPKGSKQPPAGEELELPPPPKEAPLSKNAGLAQPRPGRKSMPSSKTSATTSSVSKGKKQPLVTPSVRAKPRKSAVKGTVSAEELDELSIPADDDLMFISSRPRPGLPSHLRSQTRVKQESVDAAGGIVQSSRKRRFSMLEQSDEMDELGSDEVAMSASARRISNLPEQPEVKTEEDEALTTHRPSVRSQETANKARRQKISFPGPLQPVATPTRRHRQSSRTHTPLIDLVGDDEDDGSEMMMPATSDLYSSPTVRQTRIRTARQNFGSGNRIGLRRPTTANRRGPVANIKREGDEGVVWTPGGTMRRCGQDGFVCGRPFCFTCPQ